MKTLFKIITLILVFTLTVTAVFAAGKTRSSSKTTTSRKQIKSTYKKSHTKPNTTSPTHYNTETNYTETNYNRVHQERVPLKNLVAKEQVTKEIPKKWSIGLTTENSTAVSKRNSSYHGDIYGFQTISGGYAFEPSIKAQIVQDFESYYGSGQTAEGEDNDPKTTMLDLSVRLTKTNVLKSNDLSWLVQGRYYAPTSELSQSARQVAQLRLYFIGESQINKKFTGTILSSPRYFIQRDKEFEDTYGDSGEKPGAMVDNNHWRWLNSLGFKYSITDELAIETTGGIYTKKKYNQSTKNFQDFSTSMYLAIGSHLNLNFGIRALDSNLEVQQDGLEFYNSQVSEYFAILSLSI